MASPLQSDILRNATHYHLEHGQTKLDLHTHPKWDLERLLAHLRRFSPSPIFPSDVPSPASPGDPEP
jgi:hypothetical protein